MLEVFTQTLPAPPPGAGVVLAPLELEAVVDFTGGVEAGAAFDVVAGAAVVVAGADFELVAGADDPLEVAAAFPLLAGAPYQSFTP